MKEIFQLVLGAIQLKDQAFQSAGSGGPAGLRRSAAVVVVVALIAGLGTLFSGAGEAIRGFDPDRFRQELLQNLSSLDSSTLPPEFADAIRDGMEQATEIVIRVAGLPTPIPRRGISLIQGLGGWLGQPFTLAGSWLAYTLMALVAARLLGGKATLPRMLGATALSNAPYVLTVLAFIPYCGGVLSLAAWAWSSVLFVKATAVANDLPTGRAVLAWAAPGAALFTFWSLVIVGAVSTFIVLLLSAAGG